MPGVAPPVLEVAGLCKEFGAVRVLRGVGFSVEPGEVFGYLGPNGAGKTTTLRILLGLVHPSAGTAKLLGIPVQSPASRVDVGFLPGDLHLHGDMSGTALLDFFARFRPANPPRLRASLIDALGIDGATLQRRAKFLSHGTRQKLGLVAAMQHDPALLLLDEPTNGLDPLVQQGFREILKGFAARGRSVLFSSHVLSEVEAVCARVAILKQGEIVALESIDDLRAKAVRAMTVRFAGEPPAGLGAIAGVTGVEARADGVTIRVRGDVNPLLRALALADVRDLAYPEAQLEDIFLGYYQAARGDG